MVVNTLLSVVAGLCVYFLYPASTTVMYAITGGIGLWMILFADVAMLTAKVRLVDYYVLQVKHVYIHVIIDNNIYWGMRFMFYFVE